MELDSQIFLYSVKRRIFQDSQAVPGKVAKPPEQQHKARRLGQKLGHHHSGVRQESWDQMGEHYSLTGGYSDLAHDKK